MSSLIQTSQYNPATRLASNRPKAIASAFQRASAPQIRDQFQRGRVECGSNLAFGGEQNGFKQKLTAWLRHTSINSTLFLRYAKEVVQMFGGLCLWSLVFIPFPKMMSGVAKKIQQFSTNRFLTGPTGKPNLNLIKDKSLKAAIQEYHINLKETLEGSLSGDLKKKLKIDPAEDNITVQAWHVPAPKGRPTVIVHHGRGSNIMHLESVMQAFRKKNMGVIVYDYPGFGCSGGSPSPQSLYKSGLALSLHTEKNLKEPVALENQIIFGNSLGSIVAANTAKTLEEIGKPAPKALVLANPLPSIIDVFRHFRDRFHLGMLYNEKRLTLDMDAIQPLKGMKQTPVQVIRGEQDKYIPIELVKKMYKGIGDNHKVPFYQGGENLNMEVFPKLHHRLKDSDYPFLVDQVEKFIQR